MALTLERRFLEFLRALPGAESIDELLVGSAFEGQRRADYLLFGRRLVVEVKSLEVDTSPKVEAEIERHRDREDFPLIYGEVELHKILRNLPDGREINERIFFRVSRSIEQATRSAEEQIENTARLLNLPQSVGVLVILNERIEVLTPEVIAARVAQIIRRTRTDGTSSPIAIAWLLFEGHVMPGPAERTLPIVVVEGQRSEEYQDLSGFLDYLHQAWGTYNGHPVFHSSEGGLEMLKGARPLAGDPKRQTPMKRHELWAKQYQEGPYLAAMSDEELLRHGKAAVNRVAPYFLKGGPKASPEEIEPLMIAWNDFLCEARKRGIDLQRMRDS